MSDVLCYWPKNRVPIQIHKGDTMTSRDFCYWLQGFLEIADPTDGISEGQTEIVKRHLSMVFAHEIDPSFPAHQQDHLNQIHTRDSEILIRC